LKTLTAIDGRRTNCAAFASQDGVFHAASSTKAAIANAIAVFAGVRLRETPMTPDRVKKR
jgi:hypothetical protein